MICPQKAVLQVRRLAAGFFKGLSGETEPLLP